MDEARQDRINKARDILRHEKFKTMSREKQTEIIESLISKGLLRSDLRIIFQELQDERANHLLSRPNILRLEQLPYDLFRHVIETGDIKGADLMALCESSDKLNEYCHRSYEVQGVKKPEYLFQRLLDKMGASKIPQETNTSAYQEEPKKAYVHFAVPAYHVTEVYWQRGDRNTTRIETEKELRLLLIAHLLDYYIHMEREIMYRDMAQRNRYPIPITPENIYGLPDRDIPLGSTAFKFLLKYYGSRLDEPRSFQNIGVPGIGNEYGRIPEEERLDAFSDYNLYVLIGICIRLGESIIYHEEGYGLVSVVYGVPFQ